MLNGVSNLDETPQLFAGMTNETYDFKAYLNIWGWVK